MSDVQRRRSDEHLQMSPLIALTRAVSPRIAECELTHLARADRRHPRS